MGLLLNRRRYMDGGSSLPYDAEIEYLESTGTQYIDTGITQRQIVDAYYKLRFTSVSGVQVFFGVYHSTMANARAQVYINDTTWKDTTVNNLQTQYSPSDRANITTDYTLHSWTKAIKDNDWTLFIFARNTDNNTPLPTKMRLYYLNMMSGSDLIRDFIPVRVGQTGYLYDKVSGELFGNAGIGDFVLGPDKT